MSETTRVAAWRKDNPFGVEFAEVTFIAQQLGASGVAVGTDPEVYRLDYVLETADRFVTARLRVTTRGEGWRRAIDLRRSQSGVWSADAEIEGEARSMTPPGGEMKTLRAALDCDLGLSPLTNSMPVLRESLLTGGSTELLMAWVSVPDLSVHASRQRYTFLRAVEDGRCVVRFESVGGDFAGDIVFDSDGLVVDYPGLAGRLP